MLVLNSDIPTQFGSGLCPFPGTRIHTSYLANMCLIFPNFSIKITMSFKNAGRIRKDKNNLFSTLYVGYTGCSVWPLPSATLHHPLCLPPCPWRLFLWPRHLVFHSLWLQVGFVQWKALTDLKAGRGTNQGVLFLFRQWLSFHDNSSYKPGASPWLQQSLGAENVISLLTQLPLMLVSHQLPQNEFFIVSLLLPVL